MLVFFVFYVLAETGNKYLGHSYFQKSNTVSGYIFFSSVSKTSLLYTFSLDVFRIAPVIASAKLYWINCDVLGKSNVTHLIVYGWGLITTYRF